MIQRLRQSARTRNRALWRWVFYSKRNLRVALVSAVVSLLVLSLLSSVVGNLLAGPPRVKAAAGTPTIETVVPSVRATPLGADDHAHEDTPGPAQTRAAVRARTTDFMRAWLDTSPGWTVRVDPYLARALRETMHSTNTAAIPDARLRAVRVLAATPLTARTRAVLTDGTRITFALGWDGTDWFITSMDVPPGAAQ